MESYPQVQQPIPPLPIQPQNIPEKTNGFPKIALLIGVVIILVLLVGVGGYYLGTKKNNSQPITTYSRSTVPTSPTLIPSPSVAPKQNVITLIPTTDPGTHWNTYTIANFGLQFSLPPQIYTGQGDFKEAIGNGQAGTEVCFYFTKAEVASNNNKSGGACWTNDNDLFVAGADSVDFEAGRSGTFMDTLGFTQKGNVYYENFNLNKEDDITSLKPQKADNPNRVSIIKIRGANVDPQNPYMGIGETLSNGWIGALVNTRNTNYSGMGLQMRLTSGITEPIFDQILSTFKFTQ